jgi:hypothetical protein
LDFNFATMSFGNAADEGEAEAPTFFDSCFSAFTSHKRMKEVY